jgi:hypothetical protein
MAKPKALSWSWSSLRRILFLSSLSRRREITIGDIAEFEYPNFPLLRGPEDIATLIELRGGERRISKEAREGFNDFVEDKAREASSRLKKWLGLRRGAPRDFSKRKAWADAAALKEKNPEIFMAQLARQLDPKGYAEDRHLATERMRQGVRAIQREKARPRGKPAPRK